MHVLIIHQNFVDHKHPGGTRHLDVGADLVRKGHRVTIVASNVDYLTGTQIPKPDGGVEEYQGVRILRAYGLPTVQKGMLWRILSYISFIPSCFIAGMRVGHVDVVLGTTPPIFQLPPTWLVALFRRKPFVLEVLDLWPDFAVGMGVLTNPVLIWLCRVAERFFYRRAAHCVVNAPAYADHIQRFGVAADRITFIPMGVDLALFDPNETGEPFRAEHQLQDKFVVMYAGSLSLANDLTTVVKAAELLRDHDDIQFVLAGGGNQQSHLQALVNEKSLKNVTFAGHFAKEQIGSVLAAADVCMATLKDIPEFKMPFPNKVFDYMAAGRPILLGIDGSIREVVEQAGAGLFVQPGASQALADQVLILKNDDELRNTMSRKGRAHCEQHYDIRFQAEKFEEVFGDVK